MKLKQKREFLQVRSGFLTIFDIFRLMVRPPAEYGSLAGLRVAGWVRVRPPPRAKPLRRPWGKAHLS